MEKFEIEESAAAVEPAYKAEFGMYLDEKWYKLKAKKDILSDDPVDGLDVADDRHRPGPVDLRESGLD